MNSFQRLVNTIHEDTIKCTFITITNVEFKQAMHLLMNTDVKIIQALPEVDTIVVPQGQGERAEQIIIKEFPDAVIHMNTLELNK